MEATARVVVGQSGRFTQVKRLGGGAMGTVYEAFDRRRELWVAIKTLEKTEPATIYRIKNEFRAIADLGHPNLVRLDELVCDQDEWFLVMERVEGLHLDEYLNATRQPSHAERAARSEPRWSLVRPVAGEEAAYAQLRDIFAQLAAGVDALHRHGMQHCDLKPSNVLVTFEGRVVIVDFGLIGTPSAPFEASRPGMVSGTPAYAAPEQSRGQTPRPESDWYAVGVMLYEALGGRLPFDGTVEQVLAAKRTTTPSPIADRRVPPELAALCRELLHPDPARRPGGGEVLRRLTRGALRSSVPAPPRAPEQLFGRDAELAALRDALEASRLGPVVMHLRGPSGVGKTALARAFTASIPDALVLEGRAHPREVLPYQLFDRVMDALAAHLATLPELEVAQWLPRDAHSLARIFPVLWRVRAVARARRPSESTRDPQRLRQRAFRALEALVARLAETRALVIFIDDLEWGDRDSLALMRALTRPPRAPRVLFLACHTAQARGDPPFVEAWKQALRHIAPSSVRQLDLGPLPAQAALQTAQTVLDADKHAHARAVAREAGGVPLRIRELALLLNEAGIDDPRPRRGAYGDALLARVRRLPASAQEILHVLAVAGGALPENIALGAARCRGEALLTLAQLHTGHWIRVHPGRCLELHHPRLRHALLERLNERHSRTLHARLAEAWQQADDVWSPYLLFDHLVAAHELRRAAHVARLAGDRALEALAFERARTWYDKALALPGHDAATQRALEQGLATAASLAEADDFTERQTPTPPATRGERGGG